MHNVQTFVCRWSSKATYVCCSVKIVLQVNCWALKQTVGHSCAIQEQQVKAHVDCGQVTEETSNMRFNTGIAAMMEFVNGAYKWEERPKAALEQFVLLLAPYAPHLAEEMWQVSKVKLAEHTRRRCLQLQLGKHRNTLLQGICLYVSCAIQPKTTVCLNVIALDALLVLHSLQKIGSRTASMREVYIPALQCLHCLVNSADQLSVVFTGLRT